MAGSGRLTVITGASSNHFDCLGNLLRSLALSGWDGPAIVHDLGLAPAEVATLRASGHEVRRFDFERHPPHVDIRVRRGAYAWKPIIIADAVAEHGGLVLWLDAGNLVYRPPTAVVRIIRGHGIYTPWSSGTIGSWTHPTTLERLRVEPELRARRNRNAAIVGLDAGRPAIRDLVRTWKECALDPGCIAPEGADLSNHRFDQAILGILFYRYVGTQRIRPRNRMVDIATHNDRVSAAELEDHLRRLRRERGGLLRRLAARYLP